MMVGRGLEADDQALATAISCDIHKNKCPKDAHKSGVRPSSEPEEALMGQCRGRK